MNTPPNSARAEEAVISIALANPQVIPEVNLTHEEFFSRGNQLIWESIQALFNAGETVDHITVAQHLDNQGRLDCSGGVDKFLELNDIDHTPQNIEGYIDIIRDCDTRRTEISILSDGVSKAYGGEQVSSDIMGRLANLCITDGPVLSMEEHAENFLADCKAGKVGHFHWWCADWTAKLGRITSDLIILHAPRSTGKTALMLQWIADAHKLEQRTPLASIEMLRKELAPRLIAHVGSVSTYTMRTRGYVTPDEEGKTKEAIKEIRALELCVRDQAMTIDDITKWAIREHSRDGADAIFVDNLLSISDGGKQYQSKTIMYDDFIRKFRDLRDQLKIPIIILAHPNAEGGIAWSKDVENFADIILFLKEVPAEGLNMKSTGRVLMPLDNVQGKHILAIFQKNRNGIQPVANLDFIGSTQTFKHLSWEDGHD